MITRKITWFFLLLWSVAGTLNAQVTATSESDLKKQAEKFFSSEDYEPAMPLYSQLLSLYPQNADYNYRFGVCLLLAGRDKGNSVQYLEKAAKQSAMTEDVWYYLGKGYMNIGKYGDAIDVFKHFKKTASSVKIKKFETDLLLSNCANAIELQKNRRVVAILGSREVSRNSLSSGYDFSQASGRLVPAAEQFLSMQDKDKQLNPMMFITQDGQSIYIASYGRNSTGGKDIYLIRKMTNGNWAEPENLGAVVNTEENEDYPYLDRDGRTLYFSSRGHNSMGGYDIFKSTFDFNTGKWSEPQNLGIPVNTVDDDLFYVPTLKGDQATYCTAFDSPKGKVQQRKIELGDVKNNLVAVSGKYFSLDQVTRRDARITVIRRNDNGIVASVRTDPRTGTYELILVPGEEYTLVVEGGSYVPHSEHFSLPEQVSVNLRQEVKMNRSGETEEMTLLNYFTPLVAKADELPGAVADVPTETITSAYVSGKTDTSSLVPVRIQDQVVYVTPPSGKISTAPLNTENPAAGTPSVAKQEAAPTAEQAQNQEQTVDPYADEKEETGADANKIHLKEKDKYDPTLETPPTKEEIQQQEEEASRSQEVKAEEKGKVKIVDVDISNAELAQMAFEDARTIQEEADSLGNEAAQLHRKAAEKDSLSKSLLQEVAQLPPTATDTIQSINIRAEEYAKQAADLNDQASTAELLSKQRASEATEALTDAKQILALAGTENAVAEKTKKTTSRKAGKKKAGVEVTDSVARQQPVSSDQLAENKPLALEVQKKETKENETAISTPDRTVSPTVTPDQVSTQNQPAAANGKQEVTSAPVKTTKTPAEPVTKVQQDLALSKTEQVSAAQPSPAVSTKSGEQALAKNDATPKVDNGLVTGEKDQSKETSAKSDSRTGTQEQVAGLSGQSEKSPKTEEPKGLEQLKESTATAMQDNQQKKLDQSLEQKEAGAEGKTPSVSGEQTLAVVTADKKEETGSEPVKQITSPSAVAASEKSPEQKKSVAEVTSPSKVAVPATETKPADQAAAGKQDQRPGDTVKQPAKVEGTPTNGNLTAVNKPSQESKISSSTSPVSKSSSANAKGKPATAPQVTVDPQTIPGLPQVKKEAVVAYEGYETKQELSQKLAVQSEQLQERIELMPKSVQRDSIINVSNELSMESIRIWQEAQKQLSDAKKIEPQVESKMTTRKTMINAAIVARQAETAAASPVELAENKTERPATETVAQTGTPEQNPASEKTAEVPVTESKAASKTVTGETKGKPAGFDVAVPAADGTEKGQTVQAEAKGQPAVQESPSGKSQTAPDLALNQPKITKETTSVTPVQNSGETANANQLQVSGKQEQQPATETNQNKPSETSVSVPGPATPKAKTDQQPSKEEQAAAPATETKTVIRQAGAEKKTPVTPPVQKTETFATNPSAKERMETKSSAENTSTGEGKAVTEKTLNQAPLQKNTSTPSSTALPAAENAQASSPESQQVVEKIDSSSSEFPTYVKLQKDINTRQLETIDIFAGAVNLNRKAVEEKQKQLDLLDEAERTTDPGKKSKLVKEAEKFRKSSEKNEQLSKEQFTAAQQKTASVKLLTMQMEDVKSRIVTAGTPGTVSTEKIATDAGQKNSPDANVSTASPKDNGFAIPIATADPVNTVSPEKNANATQTPVAAKLTEPELRKMSVEVFSRSEAPVYSKENPIPMNPSLPEGLVFKVQVGAFHTPIPDNTFKNLQPVTAETTRPGWIRYCVGMFLTFEPANLVKKELRSSGYKDAFVVPYFNGKRISLGEAYAMLNKPGTDLQQAYSEQSAKEMALLKAVKIDPSKFAGRKEDEDARQFYGAAASVQPPVEPGVTAYAVQIGVYRSPVPPALLMPLQPLYTESIQNGLYRFTNGRYDYYVEADSAKKVAITSGIPDAFIVAFRDGKRVSISSSERKVSGSASTNLAPAPTGEPAGTGVSPLNTAPSGTEASALKGILFKVQLGAFRNDVPYKIVEAFLSISDKGITQETDARGLHIFYAGSFPDYDSALRLKEEMIAKGVKDAFVVALQDGRKVPIREVLKGSGR